MKTCLSLTLLVCPLFTATVATAQRQHVRVTPPCAEGSAFTISIPFKQPPDIDTVWYRWYFNRNKAPVEVGVATHNNRKITYTIPADSAYGVDVEAYFDYMLNDKCCGEWTSSPVYVMSFCQPPQISAITGDTAVCADYSGLPYSVESVSGVSYAWSVPSGWTVTTGQGTYSVTVRAGTASGTISVTPTNSVTGCVGFTPSTMAVSTTTCYNPCSSIIAGVVSGVDACSGVSSAGTVSGVDACGGVSSAGIVSVDACSGVSSAGTVSGVDACSGVSSAGTVSGVDACSGVSSAGTVSSVGACGGVSSAGIVSVDTCSGVSDAGTINYYSQ